MGLGVIHCPHEKTPPCSPPLCFLANLQTRCPYAGLLSCHHCLVVHLRHSRSHCHWTTWHFFSSQSTARHLNFSPVHGHVREVCLGRFLFRWLCSLNKCFLSLLLRETVLAAPVLWRSTMLSSPITDFLLPLTKVQLSRLLKREHWPSHFRTQCLFLGRDYWSVCCSSTRRTLHFLAEVRFFLLKQWHSENPGQERGCRECFS